MTHNEIYNKLKTYNTTDRIILIRSEYKGTDKGFENILLDIIDELQSKFNEKYYERLNDLWMWYNRIDEVTDKLSILNQITDHKLNSKDAFIETLRNDVNAYLTPDTSVKQIKPITVKPASRIFAPGGLEKWTKGFDYYKIYRGTEPVDLKFLYSKMVEDNLIFATPTEFVKWLNADFDKTRPIQIKRLRQYRKLELLEHTHIDRLDAYNTNYSI